MKTKTVDGHYGVTCQGERVFVKDPQVSWFTTLIISLWQHKGWILSSFILIYLAIGLSRLVVAAEGIKGSHYIPFFDAWWVAIAKWRAS